MILSSRTAASTGLPPYYLVYFLLVDLLEFPSLGAWEKSAWMIPVRYKDRVYGVEHRKSGVGIFAPNLEVGARFSVKPTEQNEQDAEEICKRIVRAVDVAQPYFEWRAEQAAAGIALNVANRSDVLFERFSYFRDRYNELEQAAEANRLEREAQRAARKFTQAALRAESFPTIPQFYRMQHEALWNAQAAVDAFFGWTEHAFIHIAILRGRALTGNQVAELAEADWKAKYRAAIDIDEPGSKRFYDELLDIRARMRNFMAHGAFGKRGQAFSFHSGAGAVPVLVTHRMRHRYSLTGKQAFSERAALATIGDFIVHLWSGTRAPAQLWLASALPTMLSYASDGTYRHAMSSPEAMKEFVKGLQAEFDRAANMDW